jgi:hypothetical protein
MADENKIKTMIKAVEDSHKLIEDVKKRFFERSTPEDDGGIYTSTLFAYSIACYYAAFLEECGEEWTNEWLNYFLADMAAFINQFSNVDLRIIAIRTDKEKI